MPRKKTIKKPDDSWKSDFEQHTMRGHFQLTLSHTMIEHLCAVSDNVHWDRARYSSLHAPDNWLATQNALMKRGLIRRKERRAPKKRTGDFWTDSAIGWELTPAGKHLIRLFKEVGIFHEAEGATIRKYA